MEAPPAQEDPDSGTEPSRADRVASAATVGVLVVLALSGAARDGGSAALGIPHEQAVQQLKQAQAKGEAVPVDTRNGSVWRRK